jgi:hypothetical protein
MGRLDGWGGPLYCMGVIGRSYEGCALKNEEEMRAAFGYLSRVRAKPLMNWRCNRINTISGGTDANTAAAMTTP